MEAVKNCRHAFQTFAKFCTDCGKKLELLCPGCGGATRTTYNFCGNCGAEVPK